MFDGRAVTESFLERFAESGELYRRACRVLPGGLTHDSRQQSPFPIYVKRVDGAYKWSVEGHRLVDYLMGHGSVILGHNHPEIRSAVEAALAGGTHFSGSHEPEVQWAEQICKMLPSAEMVRFTGTGSEAVTLSFRLARAFTGRPRLLRLEGHFHGWHDEPAVGSKLPIDVLPSIGLHPRAAEFVTVIPANDPEALRSALETGEYAAVIMEPTGASWGTVPMQNGYLERARALTRQTETILIFDEVISGFRVSPGGLQGACGVTPDLTTLAKIVAGGMPSGAVAGRADIVSTMTIRGDAEADRRRRVAQQGTFNANPIAATAGLVALRILASGQAHATIGRLGHRLREGMNAVLRQLDLPGCVYGEGSMFHIFVGEGCPIRVEDDRVVGVLDTQRLLSGMPQLNDLRLAMQVQGIDLLRNGGLISAAHTDADIDATIEAFETALRNLLPPGRR